MSVREVKITHEEAATVGVHAWTVNYGPAIRPLLIAKGVPEECLEIGGTRCVIVRYDPDGTVFAVREP